VAILSQTTANQAGVAAHARQLTLELGLNSNDSKPESALKCKDVFRFGTSTFENRSKSIPVKPQWWGAGKEDCNDEEGTLVAASMRCT
jgi:hypothetical protein